MLNDTNLSLLEDLGVTVDPGLLGVEHEHQEEDEIRTRAFWSACKFDRYGWNL